MGFFSRRLLKSRAIRGYLSNGLTCRTWQEEGDYMSSAFDWRAKAACRDKDPELFFPVGNTGAAYQQIEEAKAVCRTCKVIDACLKCALDTNQDYGVWGRRTSCAQAPCHACPPLPSHADADLKFSKIHHCIRSANSDLQRKCPVDFPWSTGHFRIFPIVPAPHAASYRALLGCHRHDGAPNGPCLRNRC